MGLLDNATNALQQVGRVGRFATGKGAGLVSVARRPFARPPSDLNDPAIARKVETEIFRPRSVPKGHINVNVVDGVVYLRGEARNASQVDEIEAIARAIPEVVDVQNLLHLPNEPARPAEKQVKGDMPRGEARQMNADKTSPRTGESPKELAKERAGRPPAKLGTKDS